MTGVSTGAWRRAGVLRWKLHHTSRSQGRQDRLVAKRGHGHGTISVCNLDTCISSDHSHTRPSETASLVHSSRLVLKLSFPRKQPSHHRAPLRCAWRRLDVRCWQLDTTICPSVHPSRPRLVCPSTARTAVPRSMPSAVLRC